MKWNSVILVGVMALLGLAVSAQAAPVQGSIGWTGAGVLTFAPSAGVQNVDWCPLNAVSAPTGCGTSPPNTLGIGNINVASTSGDFTVDNGGTGTIKDFTNQNPPTAPYTFIPVGVATT